MLLSYLHFCLKFVFTLIKLLKRREIFVILSKLCVFFNSYISSHTFIVGICLNLYIYIYIYIIYIYIYIYINIYIYIYIYIFIYIYIYIYIYICIYIYIYLYIYIYIYIYQSKSIFKIFSADAFISLFTNVTNLHINKYKVKSGTLQKFPMRNKPYK